MKIFFTLATKKNPKRTSKYMRNSRKRLPCNDRCTEMIWSISVENTTTLNTGTSHGVSKFNQTTALIISCITLLWENDVILT